MISISLTSLYLTIITVPVFFAQDWILSYPTIPPFLTPNPWGPPPPLPPSWYQFVHSVSVTKMQILLKCTIVNMCTGQCLRIVNNGHCKGYALGAAEHRFFSTCWWWWRPWGWIRYKTAKVFLAKALAQNKGIAHMGFVHKVIMHVVATMRGGDTR